MIAISPQWLESMRVTDDATGRITNGARRPAFR
jgi:hypothetical protein